MPNKSNLQSNDATLNTRKTENPDLYIRIYDEEKDKVECTKIFADCFHKLMSPIIDSNCTELIEDIIRLFYSISSYGLVSVDDNGKATGMIFGYAPLSWQLKFEAGYHLYIMTQKLVGRDYQLSKIAWKHTREIIKRIPNFLFRHPNASSEIIMLAVHSDYRAQGVGSSLMERFIEIATESGMQKVQAIGTNVLPMGEELLLNKGFKKIDQFSTNAFKTAITDVTPKLSFFEKAI